MIRVLVADDNAVVRQGLAAVLDGYDDIVVVAQAASGSEALALAGATAPDVAVLDVCMPAGDGISTAAALAPRARVLMLTFSDDEETVAAALRAGARGFLVHGAVCPEELVDAVRRVHAGEVVLGSAAAAAVVDALRAAPPVTDLVRTFGVTPREADVLDQLALGRSNAEIAAALFLSAKTVKNHLHHAYAKLGVATRAEAIAVWLRGPEVARRDGGAR